MIRSFKTPGVPRRRSEWVHEVPGAALGQVKSAGHRVGRVLDAGCECEPFKRQWTRVAPWGGLCSGPGRENPQAMKNHSNPTKQAAPVSGIHAGGCDAYHRAAGTDDRMIRDETKLYRRIELRCRPRGILGEFVLLLRRRRLVLKLRRRFRKPQALFAANHLLDS